MLVSILDNGLQTAFGHNFSIDFALQSELRKRGIPHAFYSFRNVEASVISQIDCCPHFSRDLYHAERWGLTEIISNYIRRRLRIDIDLTQYSERRTSIDSNFLFEKDLSRLPDECWRPDSLVFIPNIMQHQILGLSRFLGPKLNGSFATVICNLMFPPDWLPWASKARLSKHTYELAFGETRRHVDNGVYFTVETEELADEFQKGFGIPASLLHCPVSVVASASRSEGVIKVGFFGYSKAEKGFHLLPQAISGCHLSNPLLEFYVQIQHFEEDPLIVAAESALRGLSNVKILPMELGEREFQELCASMDILLLPYDPELVGNRGSGIYTHAVAAGIPVVAMEGTTAGKGIKVGEAEGSTFSCYCSQALADTILELCRGLDGKRAAAASKAQAFRHSHSISAYVDNLLTILTRDQNLKFRSR